MTGFPTMSGSLMKSEVELKLCEVPKQLKPPQPAAFRESHAANYCGMGVDTFRVHVHSGQITARVSRLGGARLYLRVDLDKFLQSLPVDNTAIKMAPKV